MNPMLQNVLAGLVILTLDIVITYFIIHRVIVLRDKERWIPFRQLLYNSLLRSTRQMNSYYHAYFQGLQTKVQHLNSEESTKAFLQEIQDSYQWFFNRRNEVFESIQTAAPSITSNISSQFTTIFRFLDNNVELTSELWIHARRTIDEMLEKGMDYAAISHEIAIELNVYSIKMNGGLLHYHEVIKEIIEKDAFVIHEGEVITPSEVTYRKRVSNEFDQLKKDSDAKQ